MVRGSHRIFHSASIWVALFWINVNDSKYLHTVAHTHAHQLKHTRNLFTKTQTIVRAFVHFNFPLVTPEAFLTNSSSIIKKKTNITGFVYWLNYFGNFSCFNY